jgi:hypothetical protein
MRLMNAPKDNSTGEKPREWSHWFTRSSLRRAFRYGTCLVCAETDLEERRAIRSFLYEGMMSGMARSDFLKSGGFCSRHFWIAKGIEDECWPAGGIGMAILCENLLTQFLRKVRTHDFSSVLRPLRQLHWWSPRGNAEPKEACTFCRRSESREQSTIEVLESLCEEEEFKEKLREGPLCVVHAADALRSWRDATKRAWLAQLLCEQSERLMDDLHEFIRKHDWLHRDEPMGREVDAVARSISALATTRQSRS